MNLVDALVKLPVCFFGSEKNSLKQIQLTVRNIKSRNFLPRALVYCLSDLESWNFVRRRLKSLHGENKTNMCVFHYLGTKSQAIHKDTVRLAHAAVAQKTVSRLTIKPDQGVLWFTDDVSDITSQKFCLLVFFLDISCTAPSLLPNNI